MRILLCATLLFICLATLPSVHCQNKKNKVTEYNEKDKRDTKERYSKHDLELDEDNQRYRKPKYRGRHDEEEETTEKRFKNELRYQNDEDDEHQYNKPARKYKKDEASGEVQRGKGYNKYSKNYEEEVVKSINKRNRINAKKLQESDEDDDTDEDNDSRTCTNKKGRKCISTEDDTEETDESEEDEEEIPVQKQQRTYVKKYAHEKKKINQDREMDAVLKIHKKSGLGRKFREEDDDFSEEVTVRRRGRFIYADDDE